MKYLELKENHLNKFQELKRKYTIISWSRLLASIFLASFFYQYYLTKEMFFLISSMLFLAMFVFLVIIHQKIAWKKKIEENLVEINQNEIAFLDNQILSFENGEEFIDVNHFYSFDLDVFGEKSLFQQLNRTSTFLGKHKLASFLLGKLTNEEIIKNQQAIQELANKIEWRQYFLALGKLIEDNEEKHNLLIKWSEEETLSIGKFLSVTIYIMPILFFFSVVLKYTMQDPIYDYLATFIFSINLFIAFSQVSKIKKEINNADKILHPIKQYASIIENVEKQDFVSSKLNSLKNDLAIHSNSAYSTIKKLSDIVSNINSINNIVGSIFVNGTCLYHLHILKSLYAWKKINRESIKKWLEVIAEFEALNSMANFSFNNADFIYPSINNSFEIELKDMGHPSINKNNRVYNDITFNTHPFIILTGSNMSGKSTFLRSLGVNMILAGSGAPICASKASIHPLQVVVSMRQSDSLIDGESYFFAEVKRLKKIIQKLDSEPCFVLLDEILRGTNSDDKQMGTIEIIKKIISNTVIGSIATHDLEVCQLTNLYSNQLCNKCFEVEIKNNELAFDYKLRDGICKNKSATFLMKKMEII